AHVLEQVLLELADLFIERADHRHVSRNAQCHLRRIAKLVDRLHAQTLDLVARHARTRLPSLAVLDRQHMHRALPHPLHAPVPRAPCSVHSANASNTTPDQLHRSPLPRCYWSADRSRYTSLTASSSGLKQVGKLTLSPPPLKRRWEAG